MFQWAMIMVALKGTYMDAVHASNGSQQRLIVTQGIQNYYVQEETQSTVEAKT
jgi:uncharacterized membrane-anchored protein